MLVRHPFLGVAATWATATAGVVVSQWVSDAPPALALALALVVVVVVVVEDEVAEVVDVRLQHFAIEMRACSSIARPTPSLGPLVNESCGKNWPNTPTVTRSPFLGAHHRIFIRLRLLRCFFLPEPLLSDFADLPPSFIFFDFSFVLPLFFADLTPAPEEDEASLPYLPLPPFAHGDL